jgi:hypothetical protein
MAEHMVRRPLLLSTLMQVLAEAGQPVKAGDALGWVRERVRLNEAERSRN